MYNDYLIPFNEFDINLEDEQYIWNLLKSHDQSKILDYHGYLSPRLTFKTKFATDLKGFAKKLDLRLAGIYAFTANANTTTSIHIDGDLESGPLPWRMCWYCRGNPGILSWYADKLDTPFNNHVGAYVHAKAVEPTVSIKLDMRSAFVRTNVPHKLDLSGTSEDRLTITATFKPYISWEELQSRLSNVKSS